MYYLVQLAPTGPAAIVRTADGATIPVDTENRDYADYLAWVAAGNTAAEPPAPLVDLVAYTADKRWRVEIAGCASPHGPIATDRDSQAKLLAEIVAIGAGMRVDPSIWKLGDGSFAILSNAAMLAVIAAARQHVATAFCVEAAVLDGISAGTITTQAHVDAAAWPSND